MFARLTIIYVKPDRIDEAVKLYKKSVIPEAKLQKGCCGGYLLTDRATGKGIAMTLWKTEKEAIASEENRYYQKQLVKFLDLFAAPPIREVYTISLKF